jgi:hypothetical protein
MLDDFAGNSFFLKILQRNYACKFLKTDWLLTKYGWGIQCASFAVISKPTGTNVNHRLCAGRLFAISTPVRKPWPK